MAKDKVNRSPKDQGRFIPHPEPMFEMPEGQVYPTAAQLVDNARPRLDEDPADYSEAQRTMRREMEQPKLVGEVIDAMLGPAPEVSPEVTKVALGVISQYGSSDLVLNMRQWRQVQTMIEAAVLAGTKLGRSGD